MTNLIIRQSILNTTIVYKNRRWRTRELAPVFLRVRNQINAVIFGLVSLSDTSPERLYNDNSAIMSVLEHNQFVGYNSGQVLFALQFMQFIAEGLATPRGQSLAFLQHIQRYFDMCFQLKIAFSLYFRLAVPAQGYEI